MDAEIEVIIIFFFFFINWKLYKLEIKLKNITFVNVNSKMDETELNNETSKFQCMNCGKNFARKFTFLRHTRENQKCRKKNIENKQNELENRELDTVNDKEVIKKVCMLFLFCLMYSYTYSYMYY